MGSVLVAIKEALAIPRRARWSFIDQALISGVNVLTAILLVRTLGLEEFGLFSFALIGIQFIASFQSAGILAPMMSLFDQRGQVSQSSYLAAVLLHQTLLSALAAVALAIALLLPWTSLAMPIDIGLAMIVTVSTQFQDLSRRFFYVTERPVRAFASSVVAYGVRLVVLATLALEGALTIDRVWVVIAGTSAAAILILAPDIVRWRPAWTEIKEVTRRHLGMAGWLTGSAVAGWFSASDFILLTVGTVLGPTKLGAVRAVQTLVNLINLALQALENFVPSAAAKALMLGGPAALLQYVARVSTRGVAAIVVVIATLMLLADPVLSLMYGRTFDDQLAILAILGAYAALWHIGSMAFAGLRALRFIRHAFVAETVVAITSLVSAWPIATAWGVKGALAGLLLARFALSARLVILLHRRARELN